MDKDRRKIVLILLHHLLTLVCLGVLVLALYKAYLYFNLPLAVWVLLYIAVVAYFVVAVLLMCKCRGVVRLIVHSLLLQVVPICATIFTFRLISESTAYTPIEGKARAYERSFNDLQDKQLGDHETRIRVLEKEV